MLRTLAASPIETACLSHRSKSSCFQLVQEYDYLTRPLCSDPITGPSTLVRIGPPQSLASVLSPHGWRRLRFSLGIKSLVPAVPRESLCPSSTAPSTPVAARPVIRHLADLSQDDETVLVLTTLGFTLTTRPRWVHFRLAFWTLTCSGLIRTFDPTLTTTALYRSSSDWFEIRS